VVSQATLHYIHDPLCGWCYGAAPLVSAARDVMTVRAHGGGMMAGGRRQHVTPALRQYVMQHDRRIAQLTGQPFGTAYFDGLLRDTSAVFDSEPPITAMLAAEQSQGRGLDLLARIQRAHYAEGRRVADEAVLHDVAIELGLDGPAFADAFEECRGQAVQAHMAGSRALLARVGGAGYPTLVLERGSDTMVIDIGPFLGQPAKWLDWLSVQSRGHSPQREGEPALCRIDGC
jgi:putative protein-disulfide isomerase